MFGQTSAAQQRTHRLLAGLRRIEILFTCVIAGIVAGAFVYAPLHLPTFAAVTVMVPAGLIYAWLWVRAQRAAHPRRWGWTLSLAPIGVIVAAAALALTQLHSMGQFAPLTQDRAANFDRLMRAIDRAYPYFDEKQIDWQAQVAAARLQVEAARADADYFQAIALLLAGLNDGHTMLSRPFVPVTHLGRLAEIEGQAVIVAVSPPAEAAGLDVGDVVLSVDGQEVNAAIATLPPQLRYGSTDWNRRAFALSNLLSVWGAAQAVDVTVQRANGLVYSVTLTPQSVNAANATQAHTEPLVQAKRLPSGLGYIHLGENFGDRPGHDMVAEFDAALDDLMDTPGLILDVRDNGGGDSLVAAQIAGRFLAEPFVYGRESYRQRLPTRVWWLWSERRVTPRPPRYAGPIILLTDASTVSSAEEFVVSLVDSGRAQTVGRQTAGSSGNPIVFQLPGGGRVRFSTGDLRRVGGTPIEGVGIRPDLPVTWTLEDVRLGRDPDVDAAEQMLSK